jgi:hypothetical protein
MGNDRARSGRIRRHVVERRLPAALNERHILSTLRLARPDEREVIRVSSSG